MQRDLSSPVPWRRSLRVSQERRLKRARRERRERTGRRGLVAAVCGLAVMAGGAFAHDGGAPEGAATTSVYLDRGDRGDGVRDLQRALGISVDGVFGPRTDRAVRAFQARNGLTVDGIAGPITLRALGLGRGTAGKSPATEEPASEPGGQGSSGAEEESAAPAPSDDEPAAEEPASAPASGQTPAKLQAIAQCESGGNAEAVSPSGRYRGKYQFSRETWRGVGGEGDPAAASEAEQDRRAATLYEQSGGSAWPNCAG